MNKNRAGTVTGPVNNRALNGGEVIEQELNENSVSSILEHTADDDDYTWKTDGPDCDIFQNREIPYWMLLPELPNL